SPAIRLSRSSKWFSAAMRGRPLARWTSTDITFCPTFLRIDISATSRRRRLRVSQSCTVSNSTWANRIVAGRSGCCCTVKLNTSLPRTLSDLRFHGFPLKTEGDPPGNVKYVYEEASATGPYTRSVGAYTRYGDVHPLLASFDDRLVVFGSGDEVPLDFDPSRL